MTGPGYLEFVDRTPVEGQPLAAYLESGPLPAEIALQFAIDIGSALHKAHARGIVHGALSPHSVVIVEDRAVVVSPPLHPGLETAPYRAPEQVRGEHADARSDIFAFGAILYQMAAGARAFHGGGQDLDHSILHEPAPTLTLRSPIYDAMARVVAGCLEKKPAARRQRIQNAVIELRFAGKGVTRSTPNRPAVAVPISSPLPISPRTPAPKPRPVEDPRGDQFLFRPGEPVAKMRTEVRPVGWTALFKADGQLALNSFRMRLMGFIALCLVLVSGAAVGAVLYFRPQTSGPALKFAVTSPENTAFPGPPAISPDGRNLAFSAQGPEGKRALWVRPLDASRGALVGGTEGATNPFWSPDGQYIGYFAQRALRMVRLKDAGSDTICKVDGMSGGATWNNDGTILFSRGFDDGLYKVSAKPNSVPAPVLRINAAKGESAFLWPQFLPDGNHFLFFVQTERAETTGVYGGALNDTDYRLLFASETNAVFSPLPDSVRQKNGYLLYISGRKLMGQAFNAPRMGLAGTPMLVADEITPVRSLSLAPISVSSNATLVYQNIAAPTRQLVWLDRNGNEMVAAREPGEWGPPRLSPDGKRAVAARRSPESESADLWFIAADGAVSQFTKTSAHEGSPVWSPDGSKVASFVRGKEEGNYDLYVRASEPGSRPDLLFRSGAPKYPTDWSRDGRYLFFNVATESGSYDVWGVSIGDRHAAPILDSGSSERDAALSPDGQWLAFDSDEGGQRLETYVQRFDGINASPNRRWKISESGGALPKWRADGKELFFMTPGGQVMSAAVRPKGGDFEFDTPVKLFQTRPIPRTWNFFEPSADGQKFLVNLPLEWATSSQYQVLTNCTEKLRD